MLPTQAVELRPQITPSLTFALLSLGLMADDKHGRPSLHAMQHPDLRGNLRLLPHHVGHAARGQCQNHTLLHRPEPQGEQRPQPLQTQGGTR